MSEHHVEAFFDDITFDWGWQCFTCGAEDRAFDSVADAEMSADFHVIRTAS